MFHHPPLNFKFQLFKTLLKEKQMYEKNFN